MAWYIVQVSEHGEQDNAREYGPWQSRKQAERLADRFNAAADKITDSYQPIYAHVRQLERPTLRDLKAEWLDGA